MVEKPHIINIAGDGIKRYTPARKPQQNASLFCPHGGNCESLLGRRAVILAEGPVFLEARDAKGNRHLVEIQVVEQALPAEEQTVVLDIRNQTGYVASGDVSIAEEDPMISSMVVETPEQPMPLSRISESFVPIVNKNDPVFSFAGDHLRCVPPLPNLEDLRLDDPAPRSHHYAVLGAASMDMNLNGADSANTSAASTDEEMKE